MKYEPSNEGLFGWLFGKKSDSSNDDSNKHEDKNLTTEQLKELKDKVTNISDQIFNDRFNDILDKTVDGMSKEEMRQYFTTVKQVTSFVKANFFKIFQQLKKFPISQLAEKDAEDPSYNVMKLSGEAKAIDDKTDVEMLKWVHDPNHPICKLLEYREEESISDETGEIKDPPERKTFESKSIATLGYTSKSDILFLINTMLNWNNISGELALVSVAKDYEEEYDKFGESVLGDEHWQYEDMDSHAAITGWLILLRGFMDYDYIALCARSHCMKILKVIYRSL